MRSRIVFTVFAIILLLVCLYVFWIGPNLECMRIASIHHTLSKMLYLAKRLDELKPDQWPERLTEIESTNPKVDMADMRIDLLTAKPFLYFFAGEGHAYSWYIVSPGPDRKIECLPENPVVMQYDPTNGTVSAGDWVFAKDFYPYIDYINPNEDLRQGEWERSIYGWSRVVRSENPRHTEKQAPKSPVPSEKAVRNGE